MSHIHLLNLPLLISASRASRIAAFISSGDCLVIAARLSKIHVKIGIINNLSNPTLGHPRYLRDLLLGPAKAI